MPNDEPLFRSILSLLHADATLLSLLGVTDLNTDPKIWWMNRPQGIGSYPFITFQRVASPSDSRFRGMTIDDVHIMFSVFVRVPHPEDLSAITDRLCEVLNWSDLTVPGVLLVRQMNKVDTLPDIFEDASQTWSRRVRFKANVQSYANAVANS